MGACQNCVDPDPRECAEFPNFKTLTQGQVSLIIGNSAMKSCPLDPALTSVVSPVSNLPCVSKLSETAAADQLIDHMTICINKFKFNNSFYRSTK